MKISYNWLKTYAKIDVSAEEVANMLTDCGLEVEMTEKYQPVKGGLEGLVIGKVLTCEKHPDADRLHITTVDVAGERPLNVVCGAPNVAQGQHVVVATIGTVLYDKEGAAFKIKKSKIRGIESEGMICAEDEIGLGTSHDGILVLDNTAQIGMPAAEYFNIETDYIFEIGLTPNRSDATSHIGVARDLVAVYNLKYNKSIKLEYPDTTAFDGKVKADINVEVEDKNLCPRYTGLCIKGVKVQESPEWLKTRLNSIGIRPINNVVDVTQFVLFEMGQPLHAFDADKIVGRKVFVKTLAKDTPFVTLDGVERKLSDKDLMICNAEEPMCIAGVFGGEKSGITFNSTNVFLESAYFNPVSIRKTAKYHGLKTDASFRYERGCDPNITIDAIKRAALLIQKLAGGEVSEIQDIYPTKIENCKVSVNLDRLRRLIGKDITKGELVDVLSKIEINAVVQTETEVVFSVPTNKTDVTREADLIEEFLRIYGYNNIEIPSGLHYQMSFLKENPMLALKEKMSNYLTDNGFYEVMNNSLTKMEYAEQFDFVKNEQTIGMLNPLSRDLQNMRQTLLLSGLENIIHNINHGNENLKLYEFGNIYLKNSQASKDDDVTKRYQQLAKIAFWVTGKKQNESWQEKQTEVDFFYLKNVVNNVFNKVNINLRKYIFRSLPTNETMNNVIEYSIDNQMLVEIGEVKPEILKYFGIKQKVFYAEIDVQNLLLALKDKKIVFEELNKFPEVHRDLALLIDKSITYDQIETLSFKTEKRLLKSMNLFDVYEGKHLDHNKKSYAIHYILSNKEKTLTNDEINAIMDKLVKAYEKELGAALRS